MFLVTQMRDRLRAMIDWLGGWPRLEGMSLALGLALVSQGCATSYGAFTPAAYRFDEYPIAVRYAGGAPARILGTDWIVENFSQSSDGTPKSRKTGPLYEVTRDYDRDGNGTIDLHADEPAWDLRLEHRREDAVIWLSAVPMSAKDRDKSLSVLARRLQDGMSGAETVIVSDRSAATGLSLSERRAAVRPVGAVPCILSGHEAWLLELEMANVDALALSPEGRWRRVRLVLIRSGYEHQPGRYSDKFPMFLVAGYSNTPELFARHVPEFDGFLSQIVLGKERRSQVCDPP